MRCGGRKCDATRVVCRCFRLVCGVRGLKISFSGRYRRRERQCLEGGDHSSLGREEKSLRFGFVRSRTVLALV